MAQEQTVAKLAASAATHETWLHAPVANYESRYKNAGRPIEIVYWGYSAARSRPTASSMHYERAAHSEG